MTLSNPAKRPVDITSLEMVLLWESLRLLAAKTTDDPVKEEDCRLLLRKLGAKE